jgi:enoyl-CoA hydratase/carnithine racemase
LGNTIVQLRDPFSSGSMVAAENPMATMSASNKLTQMNASREKAIISQWEVGVGMVADGGPMARLPRLIGRNRALEVLLSSEDIRADQAEAYGYINRALPDAELGAGWDACIASLGRPAAQEGIKALMARGFHKPGDVENRLGYYLGQIAR